MNTDTTLSPTAHAAALAEGQAALLRRRGELIAELRERIAVLEAAMPDPAMLDTAVEMLQRHVPDGVINEEWRAGIIADYEAAAARIRAAMVDDR